MDADTYAVSGMEERMKTLDKVIELSERCTLPYPGDCLNCEYFEDETGYDCSCKIIADALHYLKEYKANQEDPDGDHQQLEKAQKLLWEFYQNEPLTWQELRGMEGKPVFVELLKGKWKGWDVIGGFDEDDFGVAMVTVRGDDYYKADLGKTWQAYRKERE